jgi:hypothetical protein
MPHWVDTYPHTIYASVSLIDNKITGWKTGERKMDVCSNHYGGGNIKWIEFIAYNNDDHDYIFSTSSKEWFKQWNLDDNFRGFEPY